MHVDFFFFLGKINARACNGEVQPVFIYDKELNIYALCSFIFNSLS